MSKNKFDFYTHCVACNSRLNSHYTQTGLCGDCQRVTNRCKVQSLVDEDNEYVALEMYRNPMGSFEETMYGHSGSIDDYE